MNAESIIFFLLAAIIAVFSVMTVTTSRIMRAATYLLFVLFGVAGLYFLMGYTFLGSVQVMVYAGGIVVLYVFAILLTRGAEEKTKKLSISKIIASAIACLVGSVIVLFILLTHQFAAVLQTTPTSEISIKTIGTAMLSSDKYGYVLPFEAVSILLLACIVGGLLIARKR
ncbi:MAG: NADH-quinone oxidoreductase subunit J [Bacteroidaceae bacterium]